MAGHHERYIRPPLVGTEARSDRLAVWRFRLLLLLLLVGLAAVVMLVIRASGAGSEQNPGIGALGRVQLAVDIR